MVPVGPPVSKRCTAVAAGGLSLSFSPAVRWWDHDRGADGTDLPPDTPPCGRGGTARPPPPRSSPAGSSSLSFFYPPPLLSPPPSGPCVCARFASACSLRRWPPALCASVLEGGGSASFWGGGAFRRSSRGWTPHPLRTRHTRTAPSSRPPPAGGRQLDLAHRAHERRAARLCLRDAHEARGRGGSGRARARRRTTRLLARGERAIAPGARPREGHSL